MTMGYTCYATVQRRTVAIQSGGRFPTRRLGTVEH